MSQPPPDTVDAPLALPTAWPPEPAQPAPPRVNSAAPPTPPSRSALVLRLQARALEHESFQAAATAVVTELAQALACERVCVGFHHTSRIKVTALSGGGDPQSQQNLVRQLAAAMDEALDQRSLVVHPLPRNNAPGLTLAHAELARSNGRVPICTVPIASRGRMYGAFLIERRGGIDIHTLHAAKDAANFVGPLLELMHRQSQPLSGRLADAVAPAGMAVNGESGKPWGLAAAIAGLATLIVAFWPTTLRVVAAARVEGAEQRVVAAPQDGFVQSVLVRPGDTVKAGQLLMTLEDRDLMLERDKWAAETSQLDKLYREALTQDEASTIVLARAKLEQAQAQLNLVNRQIERARLVAPMDGLVLSGDLTQALGSPVKRGQELMTVAPPTSYRVVAEVDEQDIAAVRVGQRSRVQFGALAGKPMEMTVSRIAPVALALEQANVFEVDSQALAPERTAGLRPGMRGVVHVDIEPSTLGRVGWLRSQQWLQRFNWRWLA